MGKGKSHVTKKEIEKISWINSTYIDIGLLNFMLGVVGFNKVKNKGLFDEYNSVNINTIKIHDLILNAINSTVILDERKNKEYAIKMTDYFEKLSENQTKENKYYNALYMHREKINELNKELKQKYRRMKAEEKAEIKRIHNAEKASEKAFHQGIKNEHSKEDLTKE